MGVYDHFFVIRLGSLNKKQPEVDFIDSVNTPIEEIMRGYCSKPNPTSSDIKKIENMKIAI